MAGIGSLAVKLTADATGLLTGLQQAEKRLSAFGASVGKLVTQPARIVGGVGALLASPIESALKPIKEMLTAIPFIGASLAAIPTSGHAFLEWLKQGQEQVKELLHHAKMLGTTTEIMAGLQLAAGGAGVGVDALASFATRLSKKLGAAVAGSEEARQSFETLGLNWRQLASIPLDRSLGLVADATKRLSDVERTRLATQLGGRGGAEALPFLAGGSAAIRQGMEKAKDFGLAISIPQAEEVLKASKALKDIDKAIEGVQRQFAIGLAPVLTQITGKVQEWIKAHGGIQNMIIPAIRTIVSWIGKLLNFMQELLPSLKEMKEYWDKPWYSKLGSAAAAPFTSDGKSPGEQAYLRYLRKKADAGTISPAQKSLLADLSRTVPAAMGALPTDWEKKLLGSFDTLLASKSKAGGAPSGAEERAKLLLEGTQFRKKLEDELQTFGLSGPAAELEKLRLKMADLGMETTHTLKPQRDLVASFDGMQKALSGPAIGLNIVDQLANKWEDVRKSVAGSTHATQLLAAANRKVGEEFQLAMGQKAAELTNRSATELERFKADMRELDFLLERSKISTDVHARSVGQLLLGKEKSLGLGEPLKESPALAYGSQELGNVMNSWFRDQDRNPAARAAEILERMEQLSQEQLQETRRMASAWAGIGVL